MSHNTGTIQILGAAIEIGPDSGDPPTSPNTWLHSFAHTPAADGTKLVILHFRNASFPANNRLEVELGYDSQIDVFTSADGGEFWTRPVNIHALPGGNIPIRYITDGAASGSVELDRYGRGESLPGDPGHPSISNSDPFLPGASYVEPTYDPFWFCNTLPDWENVVCVTDDLGPGDIRSQVEPSTGMIVTVHDDGVSTCSVTSIGPDLVITAGHCLPNPDIEIPSSSVVFNYKTECDGDKPSGYEARFFKVLSLEKYRWSGTGSADYAILQLKVPAGGIGVPEIPMRNDIPAIGESIYGIHHPNGAVKKLSPTNPGFATVQGGPAGFVGNNIDVSGGSSGSGLFDTMGNFVGVLSYGGPCNLNYYSSASILNDIATTPIPPTSRDVMMVFDRSGSMASSAGTGMTKIEEARDAASLFVQLIRTGGGNQLGLVSFSTTASAPADFDLAPATAMNKETLVGPFPFTTGIVGGLTPGGLTTIGGGLDAARLQFPAPGPDPRTILLLTDGLQNTPPMIDAVEPGLNGIDINVIGFGTEASLDGTLLTQLAQSHNGHYKRAGSGLELKKFFALAFGDIFEAGALVDPTYTLPRSQNKAKPLPFKVCGEEAITVVVGWDTSDALLTVTVYSPSGAVINAGSSGVEHATGRTWAFLRIPLPFDSERDGDWAVEIERGGGSVEFPPPAIDVEYFVNILATGGPRLRLVSTRKKYYTGESYTPIIKLECENETAPRKTSGKIHVARPSSSMGSLLVKSGLSSGITIDADTIPARYATLMKLESESETPIVEYPVNVYDLGTGPKDTGGAFEVHAGLMGRYFDDLFTVEGNYTFRAVTEYGHDCRTTRELTWSVHVEVGIDSDNTQVSTSVLSNLDDGKQKVLVTLIPRDRYGNHLGPGKADSFSVGNITGSTVQGGITDNGDGSYGVIVIWDSRSGVSPGVSINQQDRDPVIIESSKRPCVPHWICWLLVLIILILLMMLILE